MATTLGNGMVLMDSFPFDSSPNLVYTDEGYPRGDRSVDAWTMRSTFKQFFTNGVFGTPADALQIAKGESGLTVTIQPGMCVIEGGMGGVSSKDGPLTLTLDTQAAQGNTPYGIMLRYDDNSDVRGLVFRVVKGTAGSNPVPPSPDTTSTNVFELRLGYVVVPNGATDLSSATVYNEKGTDVCPYAAPFVPLDLSGIVADAQSQAQETTDAFLVYAQKYYDLVASALDGTTADDLQNQIDNISPANFVDNVTLNQTSDAKMQVKDLGISTGKLADASVTTQKLADGAITRDKVADGVAMPTGGALLDFLYYGASGPSWERLSAALSSAGTELWAGSWVDGSIEVEGVSEYSVFRIWASPSSGYDNFNYERPGIALRIGDEILGTCLFPQKSTAGNYYNDRQYLFSILVSGDTLSGGLYYNPPNFRPCAELNNITAESGIDTLQRTGAGRIFKIEGVA